MVHSGQFGTGSGRGGVRRPPTGHQRPPVTGRRFVGSRYRSGEPRVLTRAMRGSCMQIWPGRPYPLGATYDGAGANFALFSEVAEKVELCLIDDAGAETRVELVETDAFVHHAYIPGIQPGQR